MKIIIYIFDRRLIEPINTIIKSIMNELYHITKLEKVDYHRNFLQLLEQLTTVDLNNITYEDFCKRFDEMETTTFVIRNVSVDRIVATGSLLVEKKFIHGLGNVGHIEDVVVDKSYRNMGFGKNIIDKLVLSAQECGCYKVILDCSVENTGFYEKCGFEKKGIEMSRYFN